MRRRNLVALGVFAPFFLTLLLYTFWPESLDFIVAYMLALSLLFKGAILSFYTASKLKLFAFFKGLTLLQGSLLLLKRWFLDNVFSTWLRRNIFEPLSEALREAKEYYLRVNLRAKLRNGLLALAVSAISLWLLYTGGYLGHLFLFTELKVIIISLSKTTLLLLGKILSILFNSWLTPLLEVFAFSWFFSWLERTLGPEHPITRFLNRLGDLIRRLFARLFLWAKRIFDPLLNQRIREYSQKLAKRASSYLQDRKIAYELESFDRLEHTLAKAHIDAYHAFEGMEKIHDKRKLYSLINQQTKDGINIVAFVSRNDRGDLLPPDATDRFHNDLFLLEGLASSQEYGVRRELPDAPDFSDFWILNTSVYPATLRSHSGVVPPTPIPPQSLTFISCSRLPNYDDGDLYLEYKGRSEAFVPIK